MAPAVRATDLDALAACLEAGIARLAPGLPGQALSLALAGHALMAAEDRVSGRLDDAGLRSELSALETGLRRLARVVSPADPAVLIRALGPVLRGALATRLAAEGLSLPEREPA